jgi:hypothetical protein
MAYGQKVIFHYSIGTILATRTIKKLPNLEFP